MGKKSIVIGRQFGSGGFNIGKKLAEDLGYKFYDKELVELVAKKANCSEETVRKMDESAKGSFLYSIAMGNYSMGTMGGAMYYDLPLNDKLFLAQSEIIKEKATEEPCVFVGRCADYVLKNADMDVLSVFIYADTDYKIGNIMKNNNVSQQKAKDLITKTEKQRRSYYDYFTSGDWGEMKTYDLCLDSGKLGEATCVEMIKIAWGKD